MVNNVRILQENIDRYITTDGRRIFIPKYYHTKFNIIKAQDNGLIRLLRDIAFT